MRNVQIIDFSSEVVFEFFSLEICSYLAIVSIYCLISTNTNSHGGRDGLSMIC
jgi:hypothetical protein